jgi:uncharacterized protein (UPF0262 family)
VRTSAISRPNGEVLGAAFRAKRQGADERSGVVEKPSSSVRSAPSREAKEADRARIIKVILEEQNRIRLSPTVDHERKVALYDLIEDNKFALKGPFQGPYILHLGNDGERLTFTVCDEIDLQLTRFSLPLASLRPIIKEYFLICDRYFNAISTLSPSRIEAIDMGRRGLHNDGASRLREWLADKVDMDENTARRLFTLVCVLHIRR